MAQVEKDYVGLRDLATERRAKLDDALKLFMLNREVDDLEQWIAEREVIAGSQELGQVGVIFQKPKQNESHENTPFYTSLVFPHPFSWSVNVSFVGFKNQYGIRAGLFITTFAKSRRSKT